MRAVRKTVINSMPLCYCNVVDTFSHSPKRTSHRGSLTVCAPRFLIAETNKLSASVFEAIFPHVALSPTLAVLSSQFLLFRSGEGSFPRAPPVTAGALSPFR